MTRTGSLRAPLLLAVVVASLTWSVTSPPPTTAAPADGFVEVQVARLLDTRPGAATVDGRFAGGGLVGAGGQVVFDVRGRADVPAGAVAVAVTVTVTEATADGFVTIFPCGVVPVASTVNHRAGQTVANSAVTSLSAEGQLCIHTMSPTHLVVDITGAFEGGLVPVPNARLLDTRPGEPTGDGSFAGGGLVPADGVVELQVTGRAGVAAGAEAVALTIITTGSTRAGYVSAYPCGPRPLASTLNHSQGENRANSLVVPLDASGRVCVFTLAPSHLVVDVSGYVPAGSPYTPVGPARLADTRLDGVTLDDRCTSVGRVTTGTSMTLTVAGRGAVPSTGVGAVVVNVVATGSKRPGFVTAHRAEGAVPNASMLNFLAADTVAASVIAPVDAQGRVSLFSNVGAHLVVDVVGWLPGASAAAASDACTGTFVDPRQRRQLVVTSGRPGCALLGSQNVECWILGMLGNRVPTSSEPPFTGHLTELAASVSTLCALRTDGSVTCRRTFPPAIVDLPFARPVVDLVGFGSDDGFCAIDAARSASCWTAAAPFGSDVVLHPVRTSGEAVGFVPLSVGGGPVAIQTASGTADVVVRRPDGGFVTAWTSTEAVRGHPWSTVVSARAFFDGQMCLILVDGRATCGSSEDLAPALDVEWNGDGVIRGPGGDVVNVWHDEDTGFFDAASTEERALIRPDALADCFHIGFPLADGWCRPAEALPD